MVKHRALILIISLVLLVPSLLGIINTRVNYDILSYLPENIETMKGQDILLDEFGKGGFSMVMINGMSDKDVVMTKKKIEEVDHVADVVWYDSIADISIPKEILPDNIYEFFNSENATLMAVFFDDTTSSDETMNAIEDMRKIADKQCFISGMSAIVLDTKNLSNKESPMYVLIAVLLISLGVTMDYSIFLWHSYEENQKRFPSDKNRAMAHAISNTVSSVVGSSITTVAGFLAMCFMSFTLGFDLGIVMAKGVIFGVIGCVTILPSFILTFDKAIEKTRHKDIIPSMKRLSSFIVKRSWVFLLIFCAVLFPAIYGYTHYDVYYNLDSTLPEDLDSVVANSKLSEEFNMNSTHMLLVDSKLSAKDVDKMLDDMNDVDGVSFSLGFNSLVGPSIPEEIIPESITSLLKSDNWQLILIGSEYKTASDEVNKQISSLNEIVKGYDKDGMLIGEAPATKDLIEITDKDFKTVSIVSIGAIFLIIAFVLKSVSLPVILVAVIELAIFVNMGIPAYTNTSLPFIASIVIGTIQLGATVDYAILMTTRYKKERRNGMSKKESIETALCSSIKSIIVSALGFFAATFGVGIYSSIDMISSLCNLMARGAIISMLTVIFILPSMFVVFDKLICNTSIGFKPSKM